MSNASQTFGRILRACLYLHQHGATAAELAALSGCTERTAHRDMAFMKEAGVTITVNEGRYQVTAFPKIQKLDFVKPPDQDKFSTIIFRKWYKVASKGEGDGFWYVVRADKQSHKGTRIGPIQIRGKSWYTVAVQEAQKRNAAVKQKRQEAEEKMQRTGWTEEAIERFKANAMAEAQKEMGQNYKEEDP